MGFIRETPKGNFVGVLCVISADPTALLPVMFCVPELETGVYLYCASGMSFRKCGKKKY